jgi:hypothetical protein
LSPFPHCLPEEEREYDRQAARSSTGIPRVTPQRERRTVVPATDEETHVAIARVVSFEGVNSDRMAEMGREMEGEAPPDDVNASEVVVLHDPEAEESLVIFLFETEDDYCRADEALNAMPAPDTPGRRASVRRYDVAMRMTP